MSVQAGQSQLFGHPRGLTVLASNLKFPVLAVKPFLICLQLRRIRVPTKMIE